MTAAELFDHVRVREGKGHGTRGRLRSRSGGGPSGRPGGAPCAPCHRESSAPHRAGPGPARRGRRRPQPAPSAPRSHRERMRPLRRLTCIRRHPEVLGAVDPKPWCGDEQRFPSRPHRPSRSADRRSRGTTVPLGVGPRGPAAAPQPRPGSLPKSQEARHSGGGQGHRLNRLIRAAARHRTKWIRFRRPFDRVSGRSGLRAIDHGKC